MIRELTISPEPIDEPRLLASRRVSAQMGAVIHFLGFVRDLEEQKPIQAIEYEAFQAMAEHQFQLIFDAAEKKWPVDSVRLVHRIGRVPVNEPSLWIELSAPHRAEAFAACQFIIDEMKKKVPIWKKPV